MTTPWVLNEYVHVDDAEMTDIGWWVEYEPLEYPAISLSLRGYIQVGGEQTVSIQCSRNNTHLLLIGTDDVQYAGFEENSIRLLWKEDPGDHYICISYQVGSEQFEIIPKWDWKKEGF